MEFTADAIASLVNGQVEGDGNVIVNTFAKIEEGHQGAISFLANPKYTQHIYTTESSVVLVSRDFKPEGPVKATLIRVDNPYQTVASLLDMVQKATAQTPRGIEQPSYIAPGVEVPADAYVGAFAYIGAGVTLGAGVQIYPQCYVGEGCVIGDGTVLYPGVKVYHGCRVGKRCIVHSGAVIGADGFGFAPDSQGVYNKIPQLGIVEISDDVEIGANTTIDRAMMGATHIGRGTKLDNLIQIAHNVQVGDNTVVAAQAGIAGSAKIGSRCMVGGQVGVSGHISIGDGTQLGAQCGVTKTIRPGSVLLGSPALPVGEYARQLAYIKHLDKLNQRVEQLESQIDSND